MHITKVLADIQVSSLTVRNGKEEWEGDGLIPSLPSLRRF